MATHPRPAWSGFCQFLQNLLKYFCVPFAAAPDTVLSCLRAFTRALHSPSSLCRLAPMLDLHLENASLEQPSQTCPSLWLVCLAVYSYRLLLLMSLVAFTTVYTSVTLSDKSEAIPGQRFCLLLTIVSPCRPNRRHLTAE